MILGQKFLTSIETSPFSKALLSLAYEEGKTYEPLYFDQNDSTWEAAFYYTRWERTPKGSVPRIDIENVTYDFSEPLKEIHRAARENPDFPATPEGEERIEQINQVFEDGCYENFDATTAILEAIRRIRSTLSIFVPILDDEAVIPQAHISGCDTQSPQWEDFLLWVKTHVIQAEHNSTESAIRELADNASYGGQPGLVTKIDGGDYADWCQGEDIYQILRSQGIGTASLAIFDFENGSGHDIKIAKIDWGKIQQPTKSALGIINNFIDSVFGMPNNSRIRTPYGSRFTDNIWV